MPHTADAKACDRLAATRYNDSTAPPDDQSTNNRFRPTRYESPAIGGGGNGGIAMPHRMNPGNLLDSRNGRFLTFGLL
jgi:hypothetical protein